MDESLDAVDELEEATYILWLLADALVLMDILKVMEFPIQLQNELSLHRGTFHADFIQIHSRTPLRAARVSKDAEKCKEFEFVELLLYFQLRIE